MSWKKLNFLVPEPLCRTHDGVVTEWSDPRPQPTQAEIDAVTEADADLGALPTSTVLVDSTDEVVQAILEVSPGLRQQVIAHLTGERGK